MVSTPNSIWNDIGYYHKSRTLTFSKTRPKEGNMKRIFSVLALIFVLIVGLAIPMAVPVTASPVTIDLPVTYRDFHGLGWGGSDGYSANPDFEYIIADDRGIVSAALGADKKPVYAGQPNTPTTHGQTYFDQWYRDTANVNMTKNDTLTFTYDGTNYVYDNSSFFPIDNELLGNDGRNHNFHFTMELHSSFTYQTGQKLDVRGDDDVWVFINNNLAIDLGGVHPAETASIDLDTLGLTAGQTYDFDLFFAERHTTESSFRVVTNIGFIPPPPTPPPPPTEVGGDIYSVSKAGLLTPLIASAIILAAGTTILIWRRRAHN
jgi:fibro-slime domain-containing protein